MRKDDVHEHMLSALFEIMSEELGRKTPYCDKKQYAVDRLRNRMRKKALCANDKELAIKAVQDFKTLNDLVGSTSITLPPQIVADARHFITTMLERHTTSLNDDNIQEVLDVRALLDQWRFSKGSSNGVENSHAADKVGQSMTCTTLCKPFVSQLRRHNHYFQLMDEQNGSQGIVEVKGSLLSTVPKNEETHRTIAIEPLGNMAMQLAAGRYLEDTLRYIGLDIRDQQPKNKLMAHRGSLVGGIATIDLKSASDMFTPDLVRALMPPEWYWLLMKLRSPLITLPSGEDITPAMVSTMGNGFTFPLMTFILCALIYANRCPKRGPSLFIDWSNTCVFGDDIIVPCEEYSDLCMILSQAGLIVNHDKSYCVGPFRESCGGDYYEGWDVTPFYVRHLNSDAAIYTVINQVLEWCARQEIILSATLLYLRSCLGGRVFLVPEWMNPDQGIKTRGCPRQYKYLQPKPQRERFKYPAFAVMMAIGGYIEQVDSDLFYTPRQFKTRYEVRRARLPSGYLDGAYRVERPSHVSSYIDIYVSLLFTEQGYLTK